MTRRRLIAGVISVCGSLLAQQAEPATLAWRPDEVATRLDAAIQLCAVGAYDAALRVLPEAGGTIPAALADRAHRERQRVAAAIAFRDRVLGVCDAGAAAARASPTLLPRRSRPTTG